LGDQEVSKVDIGGMEIVVVFEILIFLSKIMLK